MDSLLTLGDTDRRGLARTIHDGVGNDLSLAIRYLDLHDAYRETDPALAREKICAVRNTLHEVLLTIRRLASDLRLEPPVPNIGDALRAFLGTFDASGVVVGVRVEGDEATVPGTIRSELFIILREALRNAMAHSGARQVTAAVRIGRDSLYAAVEDDGIGIACDTAGGSGMASMRERAELLGGTFAVSGYFPLGTRIELHIPLPVRSA